MTSRWGLRGRLQPALEMHAKVCFASLITSCGEFAKRRVSISTFLDNGPLHDEAQTRG